MHVGIPLTIAKTRTSAACISMHARPVTIMFRESATVLYTQLG